MLMHVARSLTTRAGSGFDPATTQWINAVFAVDSTVVTTPQATLVDNLIVGLKADGLFTKLDRLWLFAIENQTEALVDIIADSLAMAVNTPTFTVNAGFAGNGTTSYLDSNFNPSTAGGHFAQDSAHLSVWDSTSRTEDSSVQIGALSGGASTSAVLFVRTNELGGSFTLSRMNAGSGANAVASQSNGYFIGNRSGASADQIYLNGSSFASGSSASVAIVNFNIFIDARNQDGFPTRYSTDQLAAASIGGSLTSTDAANLYSRLRTYMSAIGVP